METEVTTPSRPRDVMTSLPGGERISKADLRMEACGTVDELNSFLGLLMVEVPEELHDELVTIQRLLFVVGTYTVGGCPRQAPEWVEEIRGLRRRIADFTAVCGPLNSFILPGGCRAAALAQVCRAVCRRAERHLVALQVDEVLPYMNRLSTYLFHLARYLNFFYETKEIKL